MEMELVIADDDGGGGGNNYDDHNATDVAISNANVTPNVAMKYGPALQTA